MYIFRIILDLWGWVLLTCLAVTTECKTISTVFAASSCFDILANCESKRTKEIFCLNSKCGSSELPERISQMFSPGSLSSSVTELFLFLIYRFDWRRRTVFISSANSSDLLKVCGHLGSLYDTTLGSLIWDLSIRCSISWLDHLIIVIDQYENLQLNWWC